jgi:hypothetical protein
MESAIRCHCSHWYDPPKHFRFPTLISTKNTGTKNDRTSYSQGYSSTSADRIHPIFYRISDLRQNGFAFFRTYGFSPTSALQNKNSEINSTNYKLRKCDFMAVGNRNRIRQPKNSYSDFQSLERDQTSS